MTVKTTPPRPSPQDRYPDLKIVQVRLTLEEHATIQAAAKADRRSVNQFVVIAAVEAAARVLDSQPQAK